ncbi:MAG TPA: hypothetical protein VIV60_23195 [Polyangiaceae bacterium]
MSYSKLLLGTFALFSAAACSSESSGLTGALGGGTAMGGSNGTAASNGGNTNSPASAAGGTAVSGSTGGTGTKAVGGTSATSTAPTSSVASLPPPYQCGNQYYVQGCIKGDPKSTCGGNCVNYANACSEKAATKGSTDTGFACPQWMLFSDAMTQAAAADGNQGFNYAVVGHDADRNGIDGTDESTCCQCYQLVYDIPSTNDRQALANPDDPNNNQSGIVPVPPPLIVQSFNTGATTDSFDVFMAAGGFGAFNACYPTGGQSSGSGLYMYTGYSDDGANNGGIKGATKYTECKTDKQWVTTASLSTPACQARIETECNKITAKAESLTKQSVHSCIKSNDPQAYYHLNWRVYAMKVECPANLTNVTGCKLAPQGLPAVKKNVTTAAQAAVDASFRAKASNGNYFWTSTMQDCCMPSCSARDWVTGKGLTAVGLYNSFYTCNQDGVPFTEAP